MEYTKPWLSVEQQVQKLVSRGIDAGDPVRAAELLKTIGYYRLTGYLYPFRQAERYVDGSQTRTRVLGDYRPGTTLQQVESIIDFDRRLRLLVMDGVERIEVVMRMQVAYVLGRRSAFAHESPTWFTEFFTTSRTHSTNEDPLPSHHADWLQRVTQRRIKSDEQCVKHFREKYDDRMPIWALTEILEMGHLSRLHQGLNQPDAVEIAKAVDVPTKKIMTSWLASLNYVRNVAAHHARLFNRKLQNAPARPRVGQVPLLDHLHADNTAKGKYGTYNALAVIAYLLRSISPDDRWDQRLVELLQTFPESPAVRIGSMGVPGEWDSLDLWRR